MKNMPPSIMIKVSRYPKMFNTGGHPGLFIAASFVYSMAIQSILPSSLAFRIVLFILFLCLLKGHVFLKIFMRSRIGGSAMNPIKNPIMTLNVNNHG